MRLLILSAALMATAASALAADATYYAEQPASENRIKGAFELGATGLRFSQTDDDVTGSFIGAYASGFANVALTSNIIWGVDTQLELYNLPSKYYEWDQAAPTFSALIGTSLNYQIDAATIGIFGSAGVTNNYSEENSFGGLGGFFATYDISPATTLTGHVGWGDIRIDEDWNGFTGYFLGLGAIHAFNDNIAVAANLGYGHAKEGFEDVWGSGTYWNAGVKGAVRLTSDLPIFATAAYDYRDYQANTEDDGKEHSFRIGLSIAFGGNPTAKDTFNKFQTPATPYRAAAWGAVLD